MNERIRRQNRTLVAILCALSISCAGSHNSSFRIVPQTPHYSLRAPDASETPFPDVLRAYNGFEPGRESMDLKPLMQLRIENAYYVKGASRHGLEGFLGTEVAQYEITIHGLRFLSSQPLENRPADDTPVQRLISPTQMSHRFYRFYFEVFFKGNNSHGSVILGADSSQELDRLSTNLTAEPETVCKPNSATCTVFPEACSVSVEMKIIENGQPRIVLWRSALKDLFQTPPSHIEVKRFYRGRLTPLRINAQDPNDLQLPLLPGDHVQWN